MCGGEDGEAVARRFGRGVLVFRDDHAGLHPTGWIKDAAYFAPPDAPAFVAAIIGFYDGERAGTLSDAFESEFTPPTYRPPTDADLARGLVTVAAHHREVDEDWLRQEVQTAPLGVTKQIDWEYGHSKEVIQILTLVVNATLLGFAGSTNARVKALFDWCFGRLADGFLAATQQDTHFIVETTFLRCTVRFHVPTRSPAIVGKARDGLPGAVTRAQALVRSMTRDGVSLREVEYRFDPVERTWAPWFAAADDGTPERHPGPFIWHEGLPDG